MIEQVLMMNDENGGIMLVWVALIWSVSGEFG